MYSLNIRWTPTFISIKRSREKKDSKNNDFYMFER